MTRGTLPFSSKWRKYVTVTHNKMQTVDGKVANHSEEDLGHNHSVHVGAGIMQGGGRIRCPVNFAVVNLAVGNLAEAPGLSVVNLADTPRKQA